MADYEAGRVPSVSVIMPAYNARMFVEEAIRSVMNQTFTDWELIVLDDCSTDSTCAVVERLAAEDSRITLVRNETNLGVARTRNRGLDLCSGRYVALLDCDDVWHPEKLEKQLARMEETGAELVYCSYSLFDQNDQSVRTEYLVPERVGYEQLLRENVIGCSTVLLASSVAEQYRFQTEFYHEDYVLWLRILKDGGTAAGCTEVLVQWRYLENSRSFNKYRAARNRWRIYREFLNLSLPKSIWLFGSYALSGLKKYRKPRQ